MDRYYLRIHYRVVLQHQLNRKIAPVHWYNSKGYERHWKRMMYVVRIYWGILHIFVFYQWCNMVFMGCSVHPKHDKVIKWKHFPRYRPFVRGIHRWPVNSQYKGQWRGALILSLISAWINGWVNNRKAGDLRRRRAAYDIIVMDNTHGKRFVLLVVVRYPFNLSSCFRDPFTDRD